MVLSADLHVSAPSCSPKVLNTGHFTAKPAGTQGESDTDHSSYTLTHTTLPPPPSPTLPL